MRTALVAVVGGLLTLVGVALLVLPGPGFVLVAAGLAVLATRFTWAQKPLEYARGKAERGIEEVGRSRVRASLAAAAGAALVLVGVLGLAGVELPLVGVATAALLVLSGVGVIGSVVYARRSYRASGR